MSAFNDEGIVKKGTTKDLRNARIIDRSRIRGIKLESAESAFAVFHGATPDYFSGDAGYVSGTSFGYGGNMTAVDVTNSGGVSFDQWTNGTLERSGSGTITVVPEDEIKNWVL